jgi:hypothetical protein
MKEKRIYKYATGDVVPDGSTFLSTVIQTKALSDSGSWHDCYLVWHYFLVEVAS